MTTSTAYSPRPEDFQPATIETHHEAIIRPALPYWRDAWRRLCQNPRAIISLWLLLALLLMAVAGPLVWRVDPAAQDLEQISQPPGLGKQAVIVEDYRPWQGIHYQGAVAEAVPAGLTLHGIASTEGVRLSWQSVPGATAYHIYRHEYPPTGIHDLGLPLWETLDNTELYYEDRMGLETITYYYSVVPVHGFEEPQSYTTLAVEVKQGIPLSEAQRRGLVSGDAVGESVRLAPHPLGTDYLGRDMLARIMYGARTSLFIGLGAPLLYILFGLAYGGLSGYFGGHIDNLLMRFADFVIALPFLLFMILFKVSFGIGPGESGILPMLVAMILLSWPASARLVRGQVLQIREEPYIHAARLMGAPPIYLVIRHMLPNVMGVVLVSLTFAIPGAIFTEAFLSFIGMGVVPPTPSWGSMCNDGIRTMLSHPHELIVPAAFISVTVLAFNLLGDGLRDALDAKLRGQE
jgi:oligopeptide transport system permease protein